VEAAALKADKREVRRAEAPLNIGQTILIPISKITLAANLWDESIVLHCWKVPEIVVIISHHGCKALRISGEEVSLQDLRNEVPELDTLLERVRFASA
jgi:hypothetical protein